MSDEKDAGAGGGSGIKRLKKKTKGLLENFPLQFCFHKVVEEAGNSFYEQKNQFRRQATQKKRRGVF